MTLRYLLDENVAFALQLALRGHDPDLTVWAIGEPGAPPRGTLDPDILRWCEEHDFVLVTNNRRTMPEHLIAHLSSGRHVPGSSCSPSPPGWARQSSSCTWPPMHHSLTSIGTRSST